MEEYLDLIKQIEYHSARYYNDDDPEITDYEYDQLTQRLRAIEKEHPEYVNASSPSQHVGGNTKREAGVAVAHRNAMLSLLDVFSKADVEAFVNDVKAQYPEARFVVERKIDGLSMSLRYENGVLTMAETRGDGVNYGEDVTANARVIPDVVEKLKNAPEYLELRGEVYMSLANFDAVNERQEMLGKKIFANPRNCAAGTLRQLDSSVVKERGLSLFIFNLQESVGREFATHSECYEYLKSEGISIIEDYRCCDTFDEVWDAIEYIGSSRGELDYDIDGAVVKIDQYSIRNNMGATAKVPRWAVAYKYPPEEKEATILDIELTVGRTGRINPTAVFSPVRLCGTTVSRATLHNQDFIDDLDVGIGDTVLVYKSGEIIPKIKAVVKEKRPQGTVTFKIPDTCPVCGQKTFRTVSETNVTADIKCVNLSCPARRVTGLINFVSRDAMDIKGFGDRLIEALCNEGYLNDVADFYSLKNHRDELVEKGLIGKEKNTDKLLGLIEESKNNDPRQLLTGLGIPGVGKSGAKSLMAYYKSVDNIMAASEESLKEVEDVGDITAAAVKNFFSMDSTRDIIKRLTDAGVKVSADEKELISTKYEGLTFCITGTLPDMSRQEATAYIEANGGKVTGSVSKKTDYLLTGDAAGSKLEKAKSLGIKIIDRLW